VGQEVARRGLEGFITAFPQEDHDKANPQRSVYDQLTGVAE